MLVLIYIFISLNAGGNQREWYDCIYKEIFKEGKLLFIENPNVAIIDGTYLLYPMSQDKGNCNLFYRMFISKNNNGQSKCNKTNQPNNS